MNNYDSSIVTSYSYLQAGVDTALLLMEALVALDEVEVTLDLLLARLLLATPAARQWIMARVYNQILPRVSNANCHCRNTLGKVT